MDITPMPEGVGALIARMAADDRKAPSEGAPSEPPAPQGSLRCDGVVGEDERMTPAHYAAMRSDGLSFMACLDATAGTMELVREVDRLYGTTLAKRRAPIEVTIDEATGKQDADMQTFLRFVWNCVFLRTPLTKPSIPNNTLSHGPVGPLAGAPGSPSS